MAEEVKEKAVKKATKTTAPKTEAKAKTPKAETTEKKVVAKKEVKQETTEKKVVAKETTKSAPVKAPVKKAKSSKKGIAGQYIATGRRKDAVARVRLYANGTGKITINNRDINEYLLLDTLKLVVRQPLVLTETADKYDVIVNVYGGGYTGQTGAIRQGIAKALVKENEQFKPELKKAGFLSRDSRMKERKKYGLKKARKAPQFSKR